MKLSVVVCAYTMDRWDAIGASIRSCVEQTRKPDEILLVIDHNEELFRRATLELPEATVIVNQSTKGLSGARNSGVAHSTGDVIAFLDDDAFANEKWLEALVAPLEDPMVAGVGGWILPHWETQQPLWFPETFYWVLGCSYDGLPQSNSSIRNPIGANMAIRRSVFSSVGGFTSGIGRVGLTPLGCEETELCIRYTSAFPNERFVLCRDAVVHHRVPAPRLTWHYFWTRCWAEGLSKAAVSSIADASSGLSSERHYVIHTLPSELVRDARMLIRHPRDALIRVTLVAMGTMLAIAGLFRGHVALRRSPIQSGGDEESLLLKASDSGAVSGSLIRRRAK